MYFFKPLDEIALFALFRTADDVLRRSPVTASSARSYDAIKLLFAIVVVFGMIYGATMGAFGGVAGWRFLQVFYSAVKVPLLLIVTSMISLPFFFVINSLFGLRNDFADALRALSAAQVGLAVFLASLAPFTILWYVTSADYASALRFNALIFTVASFGAQYLLRLYYQPLIIKNPRHRLALWAWLIIFIFVGIQMGWVMRPFVGAIDAPVQFFREGAWSNAYVVVFQLLSGVFR